MAKLFSSPERDITVKTQICSFLFVLFLASLASAADRLQIKGSLECVQYDGQRTNIELAVGDVLKIELSSLPQDPITSIEIVHSRQRLQVGRILAESNIMDNGARPVGSSQLGLFF